MTGLESQGVFDEALREAATGRIELTASLLTMSSDELAAYDPAVWERIGSANRAVLLNRLSGAAVTAKPVVRTTSHVQALSNARLVELAWVTNLIPVLARGLVAGLICACVCVGIIASLLAVDPELVGPVVTPAGECPRLMIPDGSCFYRIESETLTWASAADRIGVDEYTLKAGNADIAGAPLAPGISLRISPFMAYAPKE